MDSENIHPEPETQNTDPESQNSSETDSVDAEPEIQFVNFETKVDFDPFLKLDSEIEKTAEIYLEEIIHQIDFVPKPPSFRKRIFNALAFSFGLISLTVGLYAISFSISHLPMRSHFLGVDTSSLAPQVAYEKIQAEFDDLVAAPIEITTPNREIVVTPAELGVSLNLSKSIASAQKNPLVSIYSLVAPYSIRPVVEIDRSKALAVLEAVAKDSETQPQVADLAIESGNVVTAKQINGRSINWESSFTQLEKSWLQTEKPIELIYDSIIPSITDQDVNLLANQAEIILAEPITLEFAGKSATFNREEIGSVIFLEKTGNTIKMDINQNLLWTKLASKFKGIDQPVKDATLEIIEDKPVISASNTSIKLNRQQFKDIVSSLVAKEGERTLDLNEYAIQPKVTSKDLQALGIVEKVSEFRQWFPPAQYRTHNVTTAANYIDGTILLPGEIYSMNETIKERTEENGYVPGIFISNGRFEEGLGGGVSIITTALWTTAFYAGLEKVEQRAHSIYIPRYQEGIEATVQWGSLDLKFKNSLDSAILIKTEVDLDGVTIKMFGTKKYDQIIAQKTNRYGVKKYKTVYSEAKDCIPQEGQPGFGVTVTRQMLQAGRVVKSDEFKTSYRISNEVICGADPNKKDETTVPTTEPTLEAVTATE